MAESDDKIAELQTRLENLVRTQISFQQEITLIRSELNQLRGTDKQSNAPPQTVKPPVREYVPPQRTAPPRAEERQNEQTQNHQTRPPNFGRPTHTQPPFENAPHVVKPTEKSEIEKFVGENLISKIGIVVLVIGVAIGAKYAIDNNLVSPLTRIVTGYVFGFGLLGLAVRLKEKYLNFSAVLMSGAMAILYFITFFGYSLYGLFPQSAAFAVMTFLTIFTVIAAVNYNRQIIAHLGLVGAYAVPFLLSDNSGKYAFFFTYIAIINAGILAISLKKYWKPLFYTSFIFTWAIFYAWYLISYRADAHFTLGFTFLTVFFLIFYLTFIGYKVVKEENVALENVSLVLSNSFIFYGIGFSMLDRADYENSRGLFTVGNAAIHFAFAVTISRLRLFPNDLLYLMTALIITFATISIPVQLDGNYVTLIWTTEAAILFWIGRTKQISLFQYFSIPLMILASVSLFHDWLELDHTRQFEQSVGNYLPLYHGNFVTSLLFAAAFGFIYYINKDERFEAAFAEDVRKPFGYLISAVGLFVFYNAFRIEIADYFQFQAIKTAIPQTVAGGGNYSYLNPDLEFISVIWQINYTMLFLSALSFINISRLKSSVLAYANLLLNSLAVFVFITIGLYFLSELRENYLLVQEAEYFAGSSYNISLRYISYVFCAVLMLATFLYTLQDFVREKTDEYTLKLAFDSVFYVSLLLIASSELLNLTDIYGYQDSYKLGLSILWGVYALVLIVVGINRHKKHLRIGAMALFALTLTKVFFYDIADLDTISKTIVFVSLGILMLIVSFLYNKYKSLIFETSES